MAHDASDPTMAAPANTTSVTKSMAAPPGGRIVAPAVDPDQPP